MPLISLSFLDVYGAIIIERDHFDLPTMLLLTQMHFQISLLYFKLKLRIGDALESKKKMPQKTFFC
jgi:hypothetical protein